MSELKKKYGLFTAICMVVGIVIGSGVFFKAQTILTITGGNMLQGIMAWGIGGIIMLFCVLAFSVLAQKYEKVNGVVDYAEMTIGSKYGYYVGWFMTVLYYPTMTSVLAWVSARYFIEFICAVNPSFTMYISVNEGGSVFGPECFVLAGFLLVLSFAINALSPKIAGKVQVSTTVIKLIPLLLMAVVGTIYGLLHPVTEGAAETILQENFVRPVESWSFLFPAVVSTAFAYEGWIIATSINAELKNSKRNLPIALIVGAIIIMAVYIFYFIGVSGGADVESLISKGANVAFVNVFGGTLGNILNLFVAISCMGTLNGLMLGCTRGLYSIAVRGYGPKAHIFSQVDKETNMPVNSAVVAALLTAFWLVYFFGSNLMAGKPWFGLFSFDSSELPIVTTYAFYIPIFISFMRKAKDVSPVKRFVLPTLAIIGSAAMVGMAFYAHGIQKYQAAAAQGEFSFPVLFYLITFAVLMIIGAFVMNKKKK
ncbi:MAG: APC family permease [Clostridia bacterium]|nr:APC family permease [Clostridia bacterium]